MYTRPPPCRIHYSILGEGQEQEAEEEPTSQDSSTLHYPSKLSHNLDKGLRLPHDLDTDLRPAHNLDTDLRIAHDLDTDLWPVHDLFYNI